MFPRQSVEDGTEPSERHKAWPKPDLSAKLAAVFTRCTPGMFHGPRVALLPTSVLKDGEKRKKSGGSQWSSG